MPKENFSQAENLPQAESGAQVAEVVDSFHTEKSMKQYISNLNKDDQKMISLGLKKIEVDPKRSFVISYEKEVFAAPVLVTKISKKKKQPIWITLEVDEEGQFSYQESINQEVLQEVNLPKSADARNWLENMSQTTKVVKSRPMWLYPELFDLPADEVWPKDKKVMVIGDPFQACDREDCTIVEYEYADEIVPPILPLIIDLENDEKRIGGQVKRWLEDLYHEDINSLDRIYQEFTPYYDNPYQAFLIQCFELTARISESIKTGEEDDFKGKIQNLKQLGKRFINGSWTMEDARQVLGMEKEAESEDLRTFFDYKQQVVESRGNKEAWETFISNWEEYLSELPVDYLSDKVADFEKKIEQVKHWLEVMPTSKSADRIDAGRRYLDYFLEEVWPFYDQEKPETKKIRNYRVADAFDRREEGSFGFFLPGHTLTLRQKKALEEGLSRLDQIMIYKEGLLPNLLAEKKRLEKAKVPLSDPVWYQYFNSLEHAWAKQHLFRKKTQRAVPIHGFFPYKMPAMPPQDRILALTSVTMHGWNNLGEEDFDKDIRGAIPFLTIGGKYILGPINQSVYFGHQNDGFDAAALTKVLKILKKQGVIDYEFRKGQRDYSGRDGNYDVYYEKDEIKYDQDNQVLHENESAHSLVITRLK